MLRDICAYYLALLLCPETLFSLRIYLKRALSSSYAPHTTLNSLLPTLSSDTHALRQFETLLSSEPAFSALHAQLREITHSDPPSSSSAAASKPIAEIVQDLARVAETDQVQQPILRRAISHIQAVYVLPVRVQNRAREPVKSDEPLLNELWESLQYTNENLIDLGGNQQQQQRDWKSFGFQGKDPSTDFRRTGLWGLDCFVHFAKNAENGGVISTATKKNDDGNEQYQVFATKLITDAVDDSRGPGWYPFALVSIAMSDYLVSLLDKGDLNALLLAPPHPSSSFYSLDDLLHNENDNDESGIDNSSKKDNVDPDVAYNILLRIHTLLLIHFHSHWMYLQTHETKGRRAPSVLEFETVIFPPWKKEISRWLQRGYIGGWVDERGWLSAHDALNRLVLQHQQTLE